MQEPSTFTQIIRGEIPSHKIYEDDKTIAILNIHHTRPGHTLIITKRQTANYLDLTEEEYTALWSTVRTVAQHLNEVMNTERVGVIIEGVDVPHVHVHLIPFDTDEPLHTHEAQKPDPSEEELIDLADRLRLS